MCCKENIKVYCLFCGNMATLLKNIYNNITTKKAKTVSSMEPKKINKQVNEVSSHIIISKVLLLGQVFALMPVYGILSPTVDYLKFKWLSWKVLYCIFNMITSIVMFSFTVINLSKIGFQFYRSTGIIFFSSAFFTSLEFLKLAKKWPQLMKNWAHVEYLMKNYPRKINLAKKVKIITISIALLAWGEHTLSILQIIPNIPNCKSGSKTQAFYELKFPQIFFNISYSLFRGILSQVCNILATVAWNYIDLFVIIISIMLADLFQRITYRISNTQLQSTHESFWRQIREDYTHVTNLCRQVNDAISVIVFLSFVNNLYFVCVQLLHSIEPIGDPIGGLYFFYSLLYLILRTLFLTIVVSSVHEESYSPLEILFTVPAHVYCHEINRFIQQINADDISITGMNFFTIKRSMVLTVAGTIVTYELVLIQFNITHTEKIKNANITGLPDCVNF